MPTIIGHDEIRRELGRIASLSDAPQSYLFSGPRHVGKRLVAEWFAHELIGPAANAFYDLQIIEPEIVATTKQERERAIAVETIRDMKQFLALSPSVGKRRVAIIDRAEKLGLGAANALLKVLEEPPEKSTLILVTAEPAALLPTVRSRLFPLAFRPLPPALLREAFPEAATLPQFFFDLGLPGILARSLHSPETFAEEKELLRQLFQISKLPLRTRSILAETLAQDETRARDLLEVWSLGLAFQSRDRASREQRARCLLIDEILVALSSLTRGEGAFRSLIERLLFRFP